MNFELDMSLTSFVLLSDNQYGLHYSRLPVDVLIIITERVSQTIDKNGEARVVASEVLKIFGRVCYDFLR